MYATLLFVTDRLFHEVIVWYSSGKLQDTIALHLVASLAFFPADKLVVMVPNGLVQ